VQEMGLSSSGAGIGNFFEKLDEEFEGIGTKKGHEGPPCEREKSGETIPPARDITNTWKREEWRKKKSKIQKCRETC